MPAPVMTRMSKEGLPGLLVEYWFAAHPEHRAKRHHALVDAQGLRKAWLVATDHVPLPRGPTPIVAPGDSSLVSIPGMLAPMTYLSPLDPRIPA